MTGDLVTPVKPSEQLGPHGPFASQIHNFTVRESQQIMADAVAEAADSKNILIVEAGTGTGKTFAYLVPIFQSELKTIISTGTKNLQDQLFVQDLPRVQKILNTHKKIALLKGRSNYVCLYRLEQSLEQGLWGDLDLVHQLQKVAQWKTETLSGDMNEISDLSEDSKVWPAVTSNTDNCLGKECSFWNECFVNKARKKAQEADVIVVNHHLFFADLKLKNEGEGEMLPCAEMIVFDEAHQIPEIASQFFGERFSSRQLSELAFDTLTEQSACAKDQSDLALAAEALIGEVQASQLCWQSFPEKAIWPELSAENSLNKALEQISERLTILQQQLEIAAGRSKGLERCWSRCVDLKQRFLKMITPKPAGKIHWYERFSRSFAIHATPLSIAEPFAQAMERGSECAWIFTSATLAVHSVSAAHADPFAHFREILGLLPCESLQLQSPFDYQNQSLLYCPRALPLPQHEDYNTELVEAILPVLSASKGHAFLLFTSYKAMHEVADLLKYKVEYPILIQGETNKQALLMQFQETPNAVLLATASFWEGVDVRGAGLRCVIIDRLPFSSPGDPVMQARLNAIKQEGRDPFFDYQLPEAVIMLKQGAGRLIRDTTDYGVLMIADPRIVSRNYGQAFITSLPAMQRTREFNNVGEFFQKMNLEQEKCV
jgi:ATP-dependent DNA helicase DinG